METIKLQIEGTLYRWVGENVAFFYLTNLGSFILLPTGGGEWKDYWEATNHDLASLKEVAGEIYPISKLQFLVERGKTFEESFRIEFDYIDDDIKL